MATERRRRRKGKGKKAAPVPAGATTVQDVPDHVLELILLRLEFSACIIRAAAACKRWCRLVADAGFLTLFRSIHGRRVAGHYHTVDPFFELPPLGGSGNSVFVPSTSLTVHSSRFSLDFLRESNSWKLADGRGGLLLFRKSTGGDRFPDLVVCEPVTRRYQGILCPPADMSGYCLNLFLLDGGADGTSGLGMSNFRVMCVRYVVSEDRHAPLACVFSVGNDGGWRVVESTVPDDMDLPGFYSTFFVGRANRSLYWGLEEDGEEVGRVLVLDEITGEFSIVLFPEQVRELYDEWTFRVIGGEDGALRVVRVIGNDLKVFAQVPGGDKWVLEKLVSLPEVTRGLPGRDEQYFHGVARIVAADARYVLLTPHEKTWLFSVELDTAKAEQDHQRNKYAGPAYTYELPWPPALKTCADRCRERSNLRALCRTKRTSQGSSLYHGCCAKYTYK